ncbi:MAG: hypothetical protein CVU18_18680 [Betaproteobacteria bacterium HGW-Betaproteobacteria-12]|nr:MAG: hypothetical protein CVU18_18680 [Betaproteobacteria bacterium HGW-Betaproteobacteria-12]
MQEKFQSPPSRLGSLAGRFANPSLPEFPDDLPIAPAVVDLQGHHGKPNIVSFYTSRRDTAGFLLSFCRGSAA